MALTGDWVLAEKPNRSINSSNQFELRRAKNTAKEQRPATPKHEKNEHCKARKRFCNAENEVISLFASS
jgi:hypothetical protein